MKNDRALDRWVDLKSSAQETKKQLEMWNLSFASFAVRAAALLLFSVFPGPTGIFFCLAELFIEISLFVFSELQSHDIA